MKSIKELMQILMLFSAPLLLQNCQSLADVIAIGNSANDQIKNLTDPTDAQDAATKAYVDLLQLQINNLQNTVFAGGYIEDVDGNYYNTVKIGEQIWMAENLKTTRYNDGTDIPLVTDNTIWTHISTPAYCWYNNDVGSYKGTYGALYNWYAVSTTTNGGKNVCPSGWHVPSDAEWTTLTDYLGGVSVAGGKLKETGTTHWYSPNTGATNETGFTALPGGIRDNASGGFYSVTYMGKWWSCTENSLAYAWGRGTSYSSVSVSLGANDKPYGFSVRCVKD
jgi:uncharacterized protein (TIGR02145 family)